MALFKCSLFIITMVCAGAADVAAKDSTKEAVPNGISPFSIGRSTSPLAKVIDMIQQITNEVQTEATDEEDIYDNFSCFCKDKTARLEKMVHHHASQIDLSAKNIGDKTASVNNLRTDHKERKSNLEQYEAELTDNEHRHKQENLDWENIEATFDNNKRLIGSAIEALKGSKTQISSGNFLQVPGPLVKLKNVLEIADAMGLITAPKQKALAASLLQGKQPASLLQGKHANPRESYEYHDGSDDIINLVEDLMNQMATLRNTQEEEHVQADLSFHNMHENLEHKIADNREAIAEIERIEFTQTTDIASARQTLIENKEDLADTEHVLKEVSAACQSRAEEYKARFDMRNQELTALLAAMQCIKGAHATAKNQAGSLLQTELLQGAPMPKFKALPPPLHAQSKALAKPNHTEAVEVKAKTPATPTTEVKAKVPEKVGAKLISFLQEVRAHNEAEMSTAEREQRKTKALDVILSEGKRVKSLMLTSLASTAADDPFKKVKQLITDLRWRLEKEEHAEVDKQVWCSENLEKTRHERTVKFEETNTHSMEVQRLEARMDTLERSIVYNTNKAKEIAASLVKIYTDVAQLSAQQTRAMEAQRDARDNIQEAITILRSFYSQAASTAEKGAFLQQEPEDPADKQLKDYRAERHAIHSENKKRRSDEEVRSGERKKRERNRIGDLEGDVPAMTRQGSLGDALALMETIVSDFNREIGNLEGDLDEEHQQLVKTNEVLRTQQEHAEELAKLDRADLKTTTIRRDGRMNDMQTAMNLLDLALQELEGLKPTCIDTGMSYKERVEARETEMAALKKALCILGANFDSCPPDTL